MTTSARLLAASAGQKTYLAEKPCRAGHTTERYTVSGQCKACMAIHNERNRTRFRNLLANARANNREV